MNPQEGARGSKGGLMAEHAERTRHNGSGIDVQSRLRQFGEVFGDVNELAHDFVRERPFTALGAALIAGYCLGRLLSRY